MVEQIAIALLGVGAMLCMNMRDGTKWRRYGPVLGLLGQPFWIYTSVQHQQWGMLFINALYTAVWTMGIWQQWRRA